MNTTAKHFLIVISKDVIRRNILDTDFWPELLRRLQPDNRVTLVVESSSVESITTTYGEDSRVNIVGYERQPHRGLNKLVNFLIRTGIDSHSTRTYRNRAVERGESSKGSFYIKAVLANTLGRFGWYKQLLRWCFLQLRSSQSVYDIFDEVAPDVVFTPSLIDNEFDAQFARVARQRGIQVIGMVRSWDNLNNHGVLAFVPDVFYFQNQWLRKAAKQFQGIDIKKCHSRVVGLPHYDNYHDPTPYLQDRAVFLSSLGLDPNKKLILLGGSDFYYSEDKLPSILNTVIANGSIAEPVQILFRPHPSRMFSLEEYQLNSLEHISLDDAFKGKAKFSDTEKFINLMYHSDIIINISSTLSLDAAVFDTPTICIAYDDETKKLAHFESVHRLYDHFDHYERLIALKGVYLPRSTEELVNNINTALTNPTEQEAGRRAIVETFVAPFDGQSGKRLSASLVSDVNDA